MARSARTSDRLESAARRLFRWLGGSLFTFVLLHTLHAAKTNPTLYGAAKWTTGVLGAGWLLLALGSVATESSRRRRS